MKYGVFRVGASKPEFVAKTRGAANNYATSTPTPDGVAFEAQTREVSDDLPDGYQHADCDAKPSA